MNAILLAGGKSSRFGKNKALARLDGERLIERISNRLQEVFDEVYVVVNDKSTYSFLTGVKLVKDIIPHQGPLGGLYTGLTYSSAQYNFLMACDMPCIDPNYLNLLKEEPKDYDVLIPKQEGYLEPLAAVYSKNCLDSVKRMLDQKQLKLISFFPEVTVRTIGKEKIKKVTDLKRNFYNVNYQADLKELVNEINS
ncbi:molybdenum cofactor guanylyltransferase [Natroniella sulfidigena]|uniref:molybdenum cofactor guanylyltransferase n=1 Tax=Natroniella sulfidigena TaxID=723921 RepID=UPI00200AAD85|nr:molybdenum cofactor guanylyltransferase [Natroniella sulfidigena]MCK8816090.1 molybdenum cofactor guanylyltransferase [Natroniella sulfidigena]